MERRNIHECISSTEEKEIKYKEDGKENPEYDIEVYTRNFRIPFHHLFFEGKMGYYGVSKKIMKFDLKTMKKIDEYTIPTLQRIQFISEQYFILLSRGRDKMYFYDRNSRQIIHWTDSINILGIMDHVFYGMRVSNYGLVLHAYDLQQRKELWKFNLWVLRGRLTINMYKEYVLFIGRDGLRNYHLYTRTNMKLKKEGIIKNLPLSHMITDVIVVCGKLYCAIQHVYSRCRPKEIYIMEDTEEKDWSIRRIICQEACIVEVLGTSTRLFVTDDEGTVHIYDTEHYTLLHKINFPSYLSSKGIKMQKLHIIDEYEFLVKYNEDYCVKYRKSIPKERYEQIRYYVDSHLPQNVSNIIMDHVEDAERVW